MVLTIDASPPTNINLTIIKAPNNAKNGFLTCLAVVTKICCVSFLLVLNNQIASNTVTTKGMSAGTYNVWYLSLCL